MRTRITDLSPADAFNEAIRRAVPGAIVLTLVAAVCYRVTPWYSERLPGFFLSPRPLGDLWALSLFYSAIITVATCSVL
jgi:hypothetical protein